MWKIMLGVLLSFCGVFFGKMTISKYLNRKRFFKSLSDFAAFLSNKISFEAERLPKIIKSYPFSSRDLKMLSLNFSQNNEDFANVKFPEYLSDDEIVLVKEFFLVLGKSDCYSQSEMLLKLSDKYDKESKRQGEDYEKKKKISVKLGLLAGVCIFTILV